MAQGLGPQPFPRTGGGGGFTLGPAQNVFTGANRAAAETARDNYATANPSWLASYNGDTSLNIRLEFTENSESVALYQVRNNAGDAWLDNSSSTGIQGPPGMGQIDQNIPAGTATSTIYPAPSNLVSGQEIWINVPTLTFANGVPVPEADEVFFTRNIPSTSETITIQYRGHANGNVFGANSTTLAGAGGSSEVATTFTLNDGSEQAFVEVRYYPTTRQIRVSVTERVNAGLPTINDIEVILSYTESRSVPATPATVREVEIDRAGDRPYVFAIKPSASGNLILAGREREIDTGYSYTTLFGATEDGHLAAVNESSRFLNYEDFEPISTTILDLENHASLPQFGLFTTSYTRETDLNIGVTIKPSGLNVNDLPTSATGLSSGDVWFDGSSLKFAP